MQFAKLMVVAVLIAGCQGPRATVVPIVSPPVPTATPVVTLQPTAAITPEPPVTCPPKSSQAELVLQAGPGPESITLDTEPLPSPRAVDTGEVPIVVTVLGGIDHAAEVHLDEGPNDKLEITAVTAEFLPFGNAATVPVTATASGGSIAIALPDKPLAGQLRVSVAWSSRCGDGSGSGSIGMAVVESKVAAGCPAAEAGFDAALAALDGENVTVGALGVPLIVTDWSGRWVPGAGAADIVQFSGWDNDRPVLAAPEALLVLSEAIDDLALQSIQISMYLRTDVDAYLDADSTGTLDTFAFVRRNANAKGRASIPAPLEPGSYVVEVVGTWLTSCLGLETYSAFSLEVH